MSVATKNLDRVLRDVFKPTGVASSDNSGEDPKATGWANLAKILGMTRQNLLLWRKKEGAPEDYEDVSKWKDFLAMHRDAASDSKELYSRKLFAETKRVELQAERLSLELEVEKAKLIPADKITEALMSIGARTKALLLKLENDLPASIAGRNESECAAIIRVHVDSICTQMQKDFTSVSA
jgi:hypothetical protein